MVNAPLDSSSGWQTVDVSLPEPGTHENHYDHASSRAMNASRDLEARQVESCGMFFGLQVLDGSMYELVDNRMIIKSHTADKKAEGSKMTLSSKEKVKKPSKKTETLKPQGSLDPENCAESDVTNASPEKRKVNQVMNTIVGSIDKMSDLEEDKKVQKKKKRKKISQAVESLEETNEVDPVQLSALHDSWMASTGGLTLDRRICESLLKQGFQNPTPIQAATLPSAILGRRNIVGAAATGSGKTLAYLIPIFQHILECELERDLPLTALILAPTRELALQVADECEKIVPKIIGTIVGGLAPHKQIRILNVRKPPIVIGTPGRLWQLMSSREHAHLNNLSKVRFLVIDEADRMIQQGSFPQLERILNAVHFANPLSAIDEDLDQDPGDDDQPSTRLLSLPGIRGESHVTMLGDILNPKTTKKSKPHVVLDEGVDRETLDEQYEALESDDGESMEATGDEVDLVDVASERPVQRQTFLFSATLTLPPSEKYQKKMRAKRKTTGSLTGAIAEILERAHTSGKTKVVDLTSSTKLVANNENVVVVGNAASKSEKSRLPPGLTLHTIACTQKHKDSHLYAYLVTTSQGLAGACLIFCNSIACVKRVGLTLQTLRLPVRMLHANMPQKARLKAIESLQSESCRPIVVCTDVAARGLDIRNIATIVHYDVARGVDTFIHRAGRTARGFGESAVGSSLSLVSSAEERQQKAIVEELGKNMFSPVHLDGRLLAECQERVNLASKIVSCDEVEFRTEKKNKWLKEAATAADLEIDDDLLDEGLAGGDLRAQQLLREGKRARGLLKILLAQPLVTQRFGKFLSCNAAASRELLPEPDVPVGDPRCKKQRK